MKKLLMSAVLAAMTMVTLAKGAEKHGAYLFTYFTGNDVKQEQVCYALSQDGWNYTPLNEGLPVISSDTIALKKAVRDPHILKGHNDGYYYMVLTDMASSQGWASNRGLILLRSKDLINWEHHTVHFPAKYKGTTFEHVTRVWAPQTIWDEKAGKYMVYYSILTNDGVFKYDKVCWNYANEDFSDLEGEPQLLFDNGDAAIDTDIIKDDEGTLHVFFKNENGKQKGIKQYLTKDLHSYFTGGWEEVPGFCQDTKDAVEGAGVFRLEDGTWVLMYDCYMAGHYQFCKSTDLKTFKRVQDTKTSGMFTPRHGTVLSITESEKELLEAWSELSIKSRNLARRSVPTLTLAQLEGRKAMVAEIKKTLSGPADIKAYKAQLARLNAFLAKK